MRVLLQRVSRGRVTAGETARGVERGFVALVGVTHDDTKADAERLAKKTANLRVFSDERGKMNWSLLDIGGAALVVSQFTLYADASRGRRPGYTQAAHPRQAEPIVDYYAHCLKREGVSQVEQGVFGAAMQVDIHNDGPVTIMLDTDRL